MNSTFKITYTLDQDNAAKFALALAKLRLFRAPYILWSVLVFVWIAFMDAGDAYIDSIFLLISVLAPAFIVVVVAIPAAVYAVQRKQLLRLGQRLGTVTYEFHDKYLISRTEQSESKTNYSLFERYIPTKSGYLLQLTAAQIYFVPRTLMSEAIESHIKANIPRQAIAEKTRAKKPWVAALLNAVLFGSGYLYAGRKRVVGAIVLTADLMAATALASYGSFSFGDWREDACFLLLAVAFAIDGYNEAKPK